MQTGLVLSGGGARGAYQAGVLKALAEIAAPNQNHSPFQIVTGVSAGAINISFWAAYAHEVHQGSEKLVQLWKNLKTENVFRTDIPSLSRIGLRWLTDLTFGGLHKRVTAQSLLDTTPLHHLLKKQVPFDQIEKNIRNGFLQAVAITATDYNSANSTTFVQGGESIPMWQRSRRFGERAKIQVEHVMGSAAIPLFFPPAAVGKRYYGDGCLRNLAPLSPAIHLGADKLIVVSIRKPKPLNEQMQTSLFRPSIARVLSVLLNAVFMDATDLDIERLTRINRTLQTIQQTPNQANQNIALRPIHFLWIQPSEDIGAIAQKEAWRLPKAIRYLLGGLGTVEEASEIVSYLLFEPYFCSILVDMGYRDCMNRRKEIEDFLKI